MGAYLDVGQYLDGALSDEVAGLVEQHLFACPSCRERLDSLRSLNGLLDAHFANVQKTGCLTAAETLLAIEGRPSERAREHLASCESCRADVGSIEDSTVEQAKGTLEPARPELVSSLKALRPVAAQASIRRARSSKRTAMLRSDSSRRRAAVQPASFSRVVLAAAAALAAGLGLAILLARESSNEPHDPPSIATNRSETPRLPETPRKTPRGPDFKDPHFPEPDVNPPRQPDEGEKPEHETPGVEPKTNPEKTPDSPQPVEGEEPKNPSPVEKTPPDNTPVEKTFAAKDPSPLDSPFADEPGQVEIDLARVSGSVQIQRKDAKSWSSLGKPANGKVAVKVGDRIRSSGAFVSFDGGAYEVCLSNVESLQLRGVSSGPVFGIAKGKILCEVEKMQPGKHLLVVTHHGEVECTGTVFSVDADAKRAICAVEEGNVVCRPAKGKGEPRAVAPGYRLTLERTKPVGEPQLSKASEGAWAQALRPGRSYVYQNDFESGLQGFSGETTPVGAFRGVGQSLVFEVDSTRLWGLSARAGRSHMKWFTASPNLRLQFSVWLEQESPLLVQLYNERQQKFFKKELGKQPAGKWITITIPVMELETYQDPAGNAVHEADTFSSIEIFTGDTGDRWKALLDDVFLYNKVYGK